MFPLFRAASAITKETKYVLLCKCAWQIFWSVNIMVLDWKIHSCFERMFFISEGTHLSAKKKQNGIEQIQNK